jgi:hypothetical protein
MPSQTSRNPPGGTLISTGLALHDRWVIGIIPRLIDEGRRMMPDAPPTIETITDPRVRLHTEQTVALKGKNEAQPYSAYEHITEYWHDVRAVESSYLYLSFTQRVSVTAPTTVIAIFVDIICFAAWGGLLMNKRVNLVGLLFPPAYAAADLGGIDIRTTINGLIFAVLFVTFLTSLGVTYFGKNPKANELANTVAKILLGFFVGAATSFLQIAPPHG